MQHEKINYIEFPAQNLEVTKKFFGNVFDWTFEDYGADYVAFFNAGLDGGFYKSNNSSSAKKGAALVVFYSDNLGSTQTKIKQAGGIIIEPIFSFPGGYRFHFSDPTGNEFAVWSKEK